jgi:hypothetical protein
MILLGSGNLFVQGEFGGPCMDREGVWLEGGKEVGGHIRKAAKRKDNEMVIGGISCVVVGSLAE